MKILNFGSMNLDYVYQVDHFLQPGETASALSQSLQPGGKGLNQSIALAKAGADVWHAGCLGQGGGMLADLLRENGVNASLLQPVETMQGSTVIQVNPAGENCILLYGGSNRCVTEEQIDRSLSSFGPGDWLLLQNEINLLPEILKKAHARGMRIVLNPSPCDEKIAELDFGMLSWLLVNEVEAEQLSGSRDPEEAWRQLHSRFPGLSLLVTLGGEGSVAFTEEQTVIQAAMSVRAVDTTAAGDTFTGYFLSGLMAGLPLRECMRRAAVASGIAVTRPGAAASIPTVAEVEKAMTIS